MQPPSTPSLLEDSTFQPIPYDTQADLDEMATLISAPHTPGTQRSSGATVAANSAQTSSQSTPDPALGGIGLETEGNSVPPIRLNMEPVRVRMVRDAVWYSRQRMLHRHARASRKARLLRYRYVYAQVSLRILATTIPEDFAKDRQELLRLEDIFELHDGLRVTTQYRQMRQDIHTLVVKFVHVYPLDILNAYRPDDLGTCPSSETSQPTQTDGVIRFDTDACTRCEDQEIDCFITTLAGNKQRTCGQCIASKSSCSFNLPGVVLGKGRLISVFRALPMTPDTIMSWLRSLGGSPAVSQQQSPRPCLKLMAQYPCQDCDSAGRPCGLGETTKRSKSCVSCIQKKIKCRPKQNATWNLIKEVIDQNMPPYAGAMFRTMMEINNR
jgi:hypothetical protein